MRKILFWAGLLAGLPGCALATTTQSWQGPMAQSTEPMSMVAQDSGSWKQVWARVGQASPANLPRGMAGVAVFAGQKRSGGYSIEFLEAREEADRLVVPYRIKKPRFDQMVTQGLTSPYAVKLVPQAGKPIALEEVR